MIEISLRGKVVINKCIIFFFPLFTLFSGVFADTNCQITKKDNKIIFSKTSSGTIKTIEIINAYTKTEKLNKNKRKIIVSNNTSGNAIISDNKQYAILLRREYFGTRYANKDNAFKGGRKFDFKYLDCEGNEILSFSESDSSIPISLHTPLYDMLSADGKRMLLLLGKLTEDIERYDLLAVYNAVGKKIWSYNPRNLRVFDFVLLKSGKRVLFSMQYPLDLDKKEFILVNIDTNAQKSIAIARQSFFKVNKDEQVEIYEYIKPLNSSRKKKVRATLIVED